MVSYIALWYQQAIRVNRFLFWRPYPTSGQHCWSLLHMLPTTSILTSGIRSICWDGRSYDESKCRGDGLCGNGIGGVDCELDNSIGNSDTFIDYDRLDQGTDGRKTLHSGNLAKGTRRSFDADDTGHGMRLLWAAIARGNGDLRRMTLSRMQSDSRWTETRGEDANDWGFSGKTLRRAARDLIKQ